MSGPSFSLLGAYFPSWMLCLFIAIVITILVRVIMIRIGLDDILPFRLTAYTAIVIAIACGLALFVYGR
ncbi:YtcA family lipoprotein [Brucella thiophenivorans]|uniref:YtcA family lipoprotein n=1 Tax=Brucella thiophenivorans TaxID=571255 RepID=UPI000B98A869|nr:YtcA family lipoprotein [Brucella thiophenivorans]